MRWFVSSMKSQLRQQKHNNYINTGGQVLSTTITFGQAKPNFNTIPKELKDFKFDSSMYNSKKFYEFSIQNSKIQ